MKKMTYFIWPDTLERHYYRENNDVLARIELCRKAWTQRKKMKISKSEFIQDLLYGGLMFFQKEIDDYIYSAIIDYYRNDFDVVKIAEDEWECKRRPPKIQRVVYPFLKKKYKTENDLYRQAIRFGLKVIEEELKPLRV